MKKIKYLFESMRFAGDNLNKVLDAFTFREFKKNEFVGEEGKVSKHIGFVESGMFQTNRRFQNQ
ncbi:MAG TPA: hypothetical protein DIT07_08770 [Sphingobacteriaceae bacterium]|nr:hypothetical protein [Sphingobacteriaceae bacterium]